MPAQQPLVWLRRVALLAALLVEMAIAISAMALRVADRLTDVGLSLIAGEGLLLISGAALVVVVTTGTHGLEYGTRLPAFSSLPQRQDGVSLRAATMAPLSRSAKLSCSLA
jgi:hypothetical protein